jgi:uncharacterized protein
MPHDQGHVIDFLSKMSSYGTAVGPVENIQNPCVAGLPRRRSHLQAQTRDKVPYLDLSTVEQRRGPCEALLALNRRTAPELYLEVRAPTRAADGGVGFGTEGPVVNHSLFNRSARRTYKRCTNLIYRLR